VKPLAPVLRRGWLALRAITGDDAYERYLAHCRRAHPDRPPPDRRAFYLAELDRRWRRVNRCC
jgi:uncharacterized short protein YbdD (DUF466 family)